MRQIARPRSLREPPRGRRARDWLLHGAALLVLVAFAVQGLSTAAQRLWLPSHYHVAAAAAPAGLQATAAALAGRGQAGQHEHHNAPPKPPSQHRHASGGGAHAHADDWAQANVGGAASAFSHAHGFDLASIVDVINPQSQATQPATLNVATTWHRHATSSAHRHDHGQPGVVYVDAGADPGTPAATAAGFEAYWSILPPRLQLVLQRLRAGPPELSQLVTASHVDGPAERPPRVA